VDGPGDSCQGGLAVVFSVPMLSPLYDRHIRFGGEQAGIWAEPVNALLLRNKDFSPEQLAGKKMMLDSLTASAKKLIKDFPVWNDFKLLQHSAHQ